MMHIRSGVVGAPSARGTRISEDALRLGVAEDRSVPAVRDGGELANSIFEVLAGRDRRDLLRRPRDATNAQESEIHDPPRE